MTTADTINHFILNKEMIVVVSACWNMFYCKNIGDMLSDDEGMEKMRDSGENIGLG